MASDSAAVASLAAQLKSAHHARIGVAGRTFVLKKPEVTAVGLGYVGVEEFPDGHPAIVTDPEGDRVAAPPNPVPWSSVERIEAGYPTRPQGAAVGALVGFIGGVTWMASVGGIPDDRENMRAWRPALAYGAIGALTGAALGALISTTRWKQIHPEAVEPSK